MGKIKTGLLGLLLALAVANPANANPLADFISGVRDEINKAFSYYDDFMKDISQIGKDRDIVIENSQGDLGLPDLEKIERSIDQDLAKAGNSDSSEALKTYVEVEAIRSHANSVLGEQGQKLDLESLTASSEAAQAIAALEQQGNGRQVTQEVIKDLLKQQTQLGVLGSTTNKALIELKQSTAYNNRALAKQVKQNQDAQQRKLQEDLGTVNTELAAVELLKNNLYGSKRCDKGQKTMFITQENGQPISPKKVCK